MQSFLILPFLHITVKSTFNPQMSFFIESVKPYNFSYYRIRIDSNNELREIISNVQIIYSKALVQLIFKVESSVLVFDNHDKKGAINIYHDLDTKPSTEVFEMKYNKLVLEECFRFFITSYAIPFILLTENDMYICLSRIQDDVCNMYACFFLEKGTKEQIMKIFANPASLIGQYEEITGDIELTDEQKTDAKNKLEECLAENEKVHEITRTNDENEADHQVIEIEAEQTNTSTNKIQMTKNTNIMELKTFEQLSDDQKKKLNTVLDDIKKQQNIETENVEVNEIEQKMNIVKYGRFIGNKVKIETKNLDYVVSIENYKQMKAILLLLIVNMKLNNYDLIEVRSDLDVFLIKHEDDIVVFVHDQISKQDTENIKKLTKLRAEIQAEVKELK